MEFRPGDKVGVPCETRSGPLPNEKMVGIKTLKGPLSGFVRDDDFIEHEGKPFVRGVVAQVQDKSILVKIRGSYFTTTGLAEFERMWAMAHLQAA